MAKKDELKPKTQDAPMSMYGINLGVEQESLIARPSEEKFAGKYRNKIDGFLYKHCIAPHALGKTHKAMIPRQEDANGGLIHTGLYWEGTEEEFDATFRKE